MMTNDNCLTWLDASPSSCSRWRRRKTCRSSRRAMLNSPVSATALSLRLSDLGHARLSNGVWPRLS
jgi:hypothetical protein